MTANAWRYETLSLFTREDSRARPMVALLVGTIVGTTGLLFALPLSLDPPIR